MQKTFQQGQPVLVDQGQMLCVFARVDRQTKDRVRVTYFDPRSPSIHYSSWVHQNHVNHLKTN